LPCCAVTDRGSARGLGPPLRPAPAAAQVQAAQARSHSSRTFVTPRNMKRRKPIACLLSACRRKTCGRRAGPNSAAGRRGRRRSAYEAPRAAVDGGIRLGGAESKRRRRPRLPAPPFRVTLLERTRARSPCSPGAGLLASGRMARPRVAAGGGLAAVAYVLRKGREAGGLLRLYRRLRSWAEALDRAGAALRAARPEEVFFYSSGRSSNEAAFLMQLAARAYGTANIHNCSFYCHNASSVALAQVYGSGTASITLEDLAQADLVLLAGANPASNHPRLVGQLVQLRRRGGKVLMVNPLRELG